MPTVLRQPAPFIHPISGEVAGSPRYFSVILAGASGTPPTLGVHVATPCDATTGGPRNADGQGKNADAIGIYPVPAVGTVGDSPNF